MPKPKDIKKRSMSGKISKDEKFKSKNKSQVEELEISDDYCSNDNK